MSDTREIRIRPVTRWVVTDWEQGKGSRVIEEYPNREMAWTAGSAISKALGLDGAVLRSSDLIELAEKADGQTVFDRLTAKVTHVESAVADLTGSGPTPSIHVGALEVVMPDRGGELVLDPSAFEIRSGSEGTIPERGENVHLQDSLNKS